MLIGLAQRMRAHLRDGDLVARLGGEEFLIALPETYPDDAQNIASRLCRVIRHAPFNTTSNGSPVSITASIGLHVFDPSLDQNPDRPPDAAQLIAQADSALYRAKESGRNRVIFA